MRQLDYRLIIDGNIAHVRLTAMLAQDNKHMVVCVEGIEVHVTAIQKLTEKAIHDELTGARNSKWNS